MADARENEDVSEAASAEQAQEFRVTDVDVVDRPLRHRDESEMSAKKYAVLFGAVLLLLLPGWVLPHLFPEAFHHHTLNLLLAMAASMFITLPIFWWAQKYAGRKDDQGQ